MYSTICVWGCNLYIFFVYRIKCDWNAIVGDGKYLRKLKWWETTLNVKVFGCVKVAVCFRLCVLFVLFCLLVMIVSVCVSECAQPFRVVDVMLWHPRTVRVVSWLTSCDCSYSCVASIRCLHVAVPFLPYPSCQIRILTMTMTKGRETIKSSLTGIQGEHKLVGNNK